MSAVRKRVKDWLLARKIIVSRPPGQFEVGAYKLGEMKRRGLQVKCAVDGGAASGGWTRNLREIYPDATVLCIEPRDEVQEELQRMSAEMTGIHIAKTLVGAQSGVADFYEHSDQSSMLRLSDGRALGKHVQMPVTTLDDLISELGIPKPDLIKLDLQGAELQCLDGAQDCLSTAEVVVLEVSFIPIQAGNPLLEDVVAYMSARGFRCYDIFALWHRPLDGALAQGDFAFVRRNSSLIADVRWSAGGQF